MASPTLAFVCFQLILLIHMLVYYVGNAKEVKCEVLTIPMCKNLGYNSIKIPNRFNHGTQKDAALEIEAFSPFVEAGCSPVLQFFLCSLYASVCNEDNGQELLPCRPVCENATIGCLNLMKDHGVKWPEIMESCNLLPEKNDNRSCVVGPETRPSTSPTSFTLTEKTQAWLTLTDERLSWSTLENAEVSFFTLKNISVTLMLLKNTSISHFGLTNTNVNLLTLRKTQVSHLTVIKTSVNSFKVTNSGVSHFTLTNTSLNSFTVTKSSVSHFRLTNAYLNSFIIINATAAFLTITNTTLNSFTIINSKATHLKLTNATIKSFTRTNASVSRMTLKNSDLPTPDLPPTQPTSDNPGITIAVLKFQIAACVVLLNSIIGFFS